MIGATGDENIQKGKSAQNNTIPQALKDGGIRVSRIWYTDAAAPSMEFTFDNIDRIEPQSDGSLEVFAENGQSAGTIDAPWAVDAAGKDLSTHYEVNGSTVRQVVTNIPSDASYPITIDPTFRRWKFIIPEIYFNHEETGRARNPAVIEGMVAGVCAAFAAETLGTSCAVGAAEAAGIAAVASNAYGDGKCMALRAGMVPATVDCD